jgi:uncharacterized protein
MKCPSCSKELIKRKLEKCDVAMCDSCLGFWIDSFSFENLKNVEDPFRDLQKVDIWSNIKKHSLSLSTKKCPTCKNSMFLSQYGDSKVILDICVHCQGIWFDRDEMEKVITHLDKKIDSETISHLFSELKDEVKDFLSGEESLQDEFKHVGLILKLIEYRIFSQFPTLQKIANSLPL